MALQEHLDNTGHNTEIAVDLEGRVHGPEVLSHLMDDELAIEIERLFALFQPRAADHAMGHCPAGADVPAQIEGGGGRLHPFGARGLDQRARVERA